MADEIKPEEVYTISPKVGELHHIEEKSTALTPLTLIQNAISANLDVEKLEKLMNLQERWEKNQAKKAFDEAMMNFQSECPIIIKSKDGGKNKEGDVIYKFAPIDKILTTKNEAGETVKQLLFKYGFSYLIKSEFPEGKVKAVCIIKHAQGHQEESAVETSLIRQTGAMDESKVVLGTNTLVKRYAFCNGFGIITADEDTEITSDYFERVNELIKDWKYKNDYINTVIDSLSNRKAFETFISTLSSLEQTAKFIETLAKIDDKYHRQLWTDFQKQTKSTADEWLTKLSASKLIKEVKQ